MSYRDKNFCWHGIISPEVDKTAAFYADVTGWKIEKVAMGDDESTMFLAHGEQVGHFQEPPMEGVPPHWDQYLRVEDVDASTQAAVSNGGKLIVPGTDIPPGRFSMVASPSGAIFALFREGDDSFSNPSPGMGNVYWVELHSTDIQADLAWLGATFGYTTDEMEMQTGDGGTYYVLKSGDDQVGGAMATWTPEAPSHWLAWVAVEDVDAAAKRIEAGGGKLMGDLMDVPGVGRMVVAQDNVGGFFGIITPAKS